MLKLSSYPIFLISLDVQAESIKSNLINFTVGNLVEFFLEFEVKDSLMVEAAGMIFRQAMSIAVNIAALAFYS